MKNNVGIIVPYSPNLKPGSTYEKAKLHGLIPALEQAGLVVEEFFYSDKKMTEIEQKLNSKDLVMVWVNPIENGHSRSILDSMLRRLANKGIIVSTHPDTILKMGTKEVLFSTKGLDWGTDVTVYTSKQEMEKKLVQHLKPSVSRVLKQNRASSGSGVWRIELSNHNPQSNDNPYVKVLHAQRNSKEEEVLLSDFIESIQGYFENKGVVIDQEFISPEPNGMIRCYMSQNKVVGFGHQYVKSLLRPKALDEVIESLPRIYFDKNKADYQDLRQLMEHKWIADMQKELGLELSQLPMLWDADFLYRQHDVSEGNEYVLCEINVSSVYPYPETAVTDLVQVVKQVLEEK